MKCPKCGYHSFDHLENCKKCSQDLSAHKAKFNLSGFYSPDQPDVAAAPASADEAPAASAGEAGDVDFGFDFLDEEEPAETAAAAPAAPAATPDIDLGAEEDLNLSQPFGIDGESVPAEDTASDKKKDSGDEFEF